MRSNLSDSKVEQNITETPTTTPINETVLIFSTFSQAKNSIRHLQRSGLHPCVSQSGLFQCSKHAPSVLVSFPLTRLLCFLTHHWFATRLATRKIICTQDIDSAAMWIPSLNCHGRPLVPLSAPSIASRTKQVMWWGLSVPSLWGSPAVTLGVPSGK